MRFRLALLLLALLLGACNLTASADLTRQAPPTQPPIVGRPTVTISDPDDGAEFVVNENVLVSAGAADAIGVTRIELRVNGQVVKTVSSQRPQGDQTLTALLDYRPTQPGEVALEVIAYRNTVASDPAQVEIIVRETQTQVTATRLPDIDVPVIDPNDPTCRLLPNTTVNLRFGPGTNFDPPIGTLRAGTIAPIVGRLADNTWWQVRVGATFGWVTGDRQLVSILGNCLSIPVVQPPATPTRFITPTPPPTNTLTITPQPPTLTPTPGLPDLVVTNVSLPSSITLGPGGTPVTVNVATTITNTGSGVSGQFNNVVNIPLAGTQVGLGIASGLRPGESIVLTASLTFSAPGNYRVEVRTDADNTVTEVSEVNNTGARDIIVSAAP